MKEKACHEELTLGTLLVMKVTSAIRTSVIALTGIGFMLGTAANASEPKAKQAAGKNTARNSTVQRSIVAHPQRIILVEVTGSHIPQRVVMGGQQVNSGSPLTMVRSDDAGQNGATSVYGMLSLDPSITRGRR